MTNAASIYTAHDKAFSNVSAYVILKDGELVAKVAFKFPKDGAGRLTAFVHWHGVEMVRGTASGFGYDKRSAAVEAAAAKIAGWEEYPNARLFIQTIVNDNGKYWNDRLTDAGFTVIQAV